MYTTTEYDSRSIRSVMTICGVLCRKKAVDESNFGQSNLARVLNTFDLTALGVGSTLGVGIYVLAGEVSKSVAGPAVVISFLLAAIASAFAGLCYAEFGARVPKAGSAYIYSYYCVGELVAFIIGWSLILEYMIGAASVARGISTYLDSLLNGKIKSVFLTFAPMDVSFMSPYIDFLAFSLCIILAFALASGVRESTIINNFLTFCNLSVVIFVIISGLFKANFEYWQIDKKDLPGPEAGEGGFAPFGFLGIIKGAALCFYGFIGFDAIATTGEEVKNPQRAIPVSILISLMIIFLAYFGVSSVLTLMWPYYLQDPDAPFPHVYSQIGWDAAKWFVSVGALFGMFSSLFGAMFPLPRIIYAMASDGLLFRTLSEVSPKTKTPVLGTAVAGLVTATMSALFNLQQLISLMALGTLLAYTIVAISVLILRYSPDFDDNYKHIDESTGLVSQCDCSGAKGYFLNYFNCGTDIPNSLTKRIAVSNIIVYSAASIIMSVLITNMKDSNGLTNTSVLTLTCIVGTVMLMVFLSMCSQPKAQKPLPFQMPLVPLLPCLSILLNVYLMVVLDLTTWIKLGVWMSTGIIPYICWYYWKSRHGQLGENSRYNINRVNNIKLNELVWNLVCTKKTLIDGYINEGFVNDTKLDIPEESVKKTNLDKVDVYTEKVLEFTEINNNVFPVKNVDQGTVKSSAEVHTHEEDGEMDEEIGGAKEKTVDIHETENNSLSEPDTEPTLTSDLTPKLVVVKESSKENQISDENVFAPEVPIKRRICNQPRVKILEKKVLRNLADDGSHLVKENQISDENVFAPEIPIKRRIYNQPRVKLIGKNVLRNPAEDGSNSVKKTKGTSVNDTQDALKTNRCGKTFDRELLNKLNKIIQEQASLIQSGKKASTITENSINKVEYEGNSSGDEIKTMTKTQVMTKLQVLLGNGPPKKPFFKRPSVLDEHIQQTREKNDRTEQT